MIRVNSLKEAYAVSGMKEIICGNDGISVRMATPEEIEAERMNKWRQIEFIRDSKIANGVHVNGFWWQTSINARIRYMGAAAMGADFVATESWKTMTGEKTTLTGAIASQIMMAVAIMEKNIFQAAEKHKTDMMYTEDPSTYDFQSGWPETFGEYMET